MLDGADGKKVRIREALTRALARASPPCEKSRLSARLTRISSSHSCVLISFRALVVLVLVLGLNLLLLLDDRLLAPGRWWRRRFAEIGALLLLIRQALPNLRHGH